MPSLLPYLLLAAVVVVLALLALPSLRRGNIVDEVKRFDHARALTTTWSQDPRQPVAPSEESPTDRESASGS